VGDGPAKGAAAQGGENCSRTRFLVFGGRWMAHEETSPAGRVARSCYVIGPTDDDAGHLGRLKVLGNLEALELLTIKAQVELGGQRSPSGGSRCRAAYWRRLHLRLRRSPGEGDTHSPQTCFARQAHFEGALISSRVVIELPPERILRIDGEVVPKCHPAAGIKRKIVADALTSGTRVAAGRIAAGHVLLFRGLDFRIAHGEAAG